MIIILICQNLHTKIDQNCNNTPLYTLSCLVSLRGQHCTKHDGHSLSTGRSVAGNSSFIIEWNNEPNKTWLSSYKKHYLYSNRSAKVLFKSFQKTFVSRTSPLAEINFCQVNVSKWGKAPSQGWIRVSNSLPEQLTTFAWRKLSIIKSDNSKPQHKPPLHFVFLPFNNR